MNSSIIQLLVLAGVAIFLIVRLKNVLGTRDGFEKPPAQVTRKPASSARFEVIEGGIDHDIADHVDQNSAAAKALAAMKRAEPDFNVTEFLTGARAAYEMILMAFEKGDMEKIEPFLSGDVFEAFSEVVDERKKKGLSIDAEFMGIRELKLKDAEFNETTRTGEISVLFVSEQKSVVRDQSGKIVEGDPKEIVRQKDIWTFARKMGADDPNWQLVATGE